MCASSADFADLRALLDSWQLSEMFTHLHDEAINVDELQMMKPHHVAELLHNYKLGTRIRFEHHLDVWRRSINKPLLSAAPAFAAAPLGWPMQQNARSPQPKPPCKETTAEPGSETRATITDTIDSISVATNTYTPFALPPPSPQELLVEMPPLIQKPTIVEPDLSPDPMPPAKPSSFSQQTLTLEHILQASGTKGATLKRHYKKHNELTSSHRALLIHLIVSYFESNDYHLSLNMSHNLEREVLKMFPTERLSDYRTEKRGKMYVKFCNMKRYKRTSGKRKLDSGDATNLSMTSAEGGGGAGGCSGGGGGGLQLDPFENDDEYNNWIDQHLGAAVGAQLHHQPKLTGPTPLLMEIKTEKANEDGF